MKTAVFINTFAILFAFDRLTIKTVATNQGFFQFGEGIVIKEIKTDVALLRLYIPKVQITYAG
ncbi:hypothetical protein VB735_20235 [Halotia wernerae UHCC 0503]|nr:hypothetical protein [Halotia wernerae UHCC 0503]